METPEPSLELRGEHLFTWEEVGGVGLGQRGQCEDFDECFCKRECSVAVTLGLSLCSQTPRRVIDAHQKQRLVTLRSLREVEEWVQSSS